MQAITCVRLVGGAPARTARLTAEFPTVAIERREACGVCDAIVDCKEWLRSRDFVAFDDAVALASSDALSIRGEAELLEQVACEVLTRYQRLVGRHNAHSSDALFDAVLRAHDGSYDPTKPFAKAEHDHVLDTWQWTLRLDADASLVVQLAALFHDARHAGYRVQGHAEHANRAYDTLRGAGIEARTATRVRDIVMAHAQHGNDAAIALLRDADALSFFSLGSDKYADDFGPLATRRKVEVTLLRMSARARAKLGTTRLRPDIFHFLLEVELPEEAEAPEPITRTATSPPPRSTRALEPQARRPRASRPPAARP